MASPSTLVLQFALFHEKIAKLPGGDKFVGNVADFDIGGLEYPGSHYEFGACGTAFAAVYGGFGAPLGGEAAHTP